MKETVKRIVTDRFFLFLLIGGSFFVFETWRPTEDERLIVVSEDDLDVLRSRWTVQMDAAPDESELESLIDRHIREEILVREAFRLGLDDGDVILRRRLAEKMELLLRDRIEESPILESDLEKYFAENRERYDKPRRVGFRHIYLKAETEAEAAAEASELLAKLSASTDRGLWRRLGRAFMLSRQYGPRNRQALTEKFGSQFADSLLDESLERSVWWGPVRSSYGFHLVQLAAVLEGGEVSLEDVRAAAYRDLREKRFSALNDEAWSNLRDGYRIELPASVEP
ncbi:MAG: peptidylprolyl isomerase [Acidobacteriota bacterium]